MPGEYYARHGDSYPFLYLDCGAVTNPITGELLLRLYCIEEAREYVVGYQDFNDLFFWQGRHYKAETLNKRRQKWREHIARERPLPPKPEPVTTGAADPWAD
jgi:hypothetical protein